MNLDELNNNKELFNFLKNMSMINQMMGMMSKMGGDDVQKNISNLPQIKEKEEISHSNAKTPQNSNFSSSNTGNNFSNKKRERKISNITDDEEITYREKLKNIISQVEINEVVLKLLSKLSLKDPTYDMILAENKLGKWKCSVKISYGGNDMFQGTGFNNQKKKAKSKKIK
jgi:hypothetical protein